MGEDKKNNNSKVLPFRNGRAIDWELLFNEWVKSRKPRAQFLRDNGLDPGSGNVKRATNQWTADIKFAHKKTKKAGLKATRPVAEIADIWQIIQQWRKGQAINDYKAAEAIRNHVELILKSGLEVVEVGSKKVKRVTLKPVDLKHLAECIEKLQRIQRLALGMSTDNIGVDIGETDSRVEQVTDDCPVFAVEVNKNGKFIRPRPRQVN
jgi:hypothetical protein